MAPKAAHEAARKKAAKEKKILIVLAVPLLAALVYAYMTLSSMGGGGSPQPVSATPAAQTTPASSIPTGASAPVVMPGIAVAPVGSLRSFVSLGRKDPFNDAGPHSAVSSSSSKISDAGKGSSGNSGNSGNSHSGGGSNPKQPPTPLTGAVISFNGTKLSLALGAKFGHAPGLSGVSLFRLISVTRTSAVIGVVGTPQRFTLHVRRTLTLEQVGGWKYALILEPLGSAAPMTVAP